MSFLTSILLVTELCKAATTIQNSFRNHMKTKQGEGGKDGASSAKEENKVSYNLTIEKFSQFIAARKFAVLEFYRAIPELLGMFYVFSCSAIELCIRAIFRLRIQNKHYCVN